jgi:hypothetical protein
MFLLQFLIFNIFFFRAIHTKHGTPGALRRARQPTAEAMKRSQRGSLGEDCVDDSQCEGQARELVIMSEPKLTGPRIFPAETVTQGDISLGLMQTS